MPLAEKKLELQGVHAAGMPLAEQQHCELQGVHEAGSPLDEQQLAELQTELLVRQLLEVQFLQWKVSCCLHERIH